MHSCAVRDLGYTATAVVTLALTIGATTATFSIVNVRAAEAARLSRSRNNW